MGPLLLLSILMALAISLAFTLPAEAATGDWLSAWGKDVNGGGVFGICTVAASCNAGTTGGLGGEMIVPYGVATDSSGNLYVADAGNNRIQKFDSSGNFLRAWGKDVNGGGVFGICTVAASCQTGTFGGLGGEMFLPQGISIDTAGNVFVADTANYRIQEFDSSGNFLRAWGNDVNGGGVFGICTVAASCQTGVGGSLGGEMESPVGVATESSGNLYVADSGNNRIQMFDSSGNFLRAWGKDVNGGGVFGVCIVAASCQTGTVGGLGGEMNNPVGLAVDTAGNLYITDNFENRVQKFGSSGNFLRAWGKDVNGGGVFGICTVAASCQTGVFGSLSGELNVPNGVATDSSGNLYVSESGNNRIQMFDSSGNFLRAWGKGVNGGGVFGICTVTAICQQGLSGDLGGEMNNPYGLASGIGGDLYLADSINNRVQRFAGGGDFTPPDTTIDSGPSGPTNNPTPTFTFSSNEPGSTFECSVDAGAYSSCTSPKTLAALPDGAHTFEVRATDPDLNTDPTPASRSFTLDTSVPVPVPTPTNGVTGVVSPVSGVVRIKTPGGKYRILTEGEAIPIGSLIDTTRGRVRLTTATGDGNSTQTADFYAGAFKLTQAKGSTLVAPVLVGGNFKVCKKKKRRKKRHHRRSFLLSAFTGAWTSGPAPSRSHATVRKLWGSGKGSFRTKGKWGSATVRGTKWLTVDRCDGTFFKVAHGIVDVKDFGKPRKKISLTGGEHYLAKARR